MDDWTDILSTCTSCPSAKSTLSYQKPLSFCPRAFFCPALCTSATPPPPPPHCSHELVPGVCLTEYDRASATPLPCQRVQKQTGGSGKREKEPCLSSSGGLGTDSSSPPGSHLMSYAVDTLSALTHSLTQSLTRSHQLLFSLFRHFFHN